MSKTKQIAIILQDTLQQVGLSSLLVEYFPPVKVIYFSSYTEIANQTDSFDLYFTNAENYVSGLDFFLLRKNKTFILVNTDTVQENSNFIPVKTSVETLIEYLQPILENESSFSSKENGKKLSSREIEVLKQIVVGATNKEIADILNISLNTVLTHRKNITAKLGIKTVPGLTFYAIMNGMITGEEF